MLVHGKKPVSDKLADQLKRASGIPERKAVMEHGQKSPADCFKNSG